MRCQSFRYGDIIIKEALYFFCGRHASPASPMLTVFVMATKTKFSVKSLRIFLLRVFVLQTFPLTYRRTTSPTHSPYFHVTNFSLKRPLPWPLVNFGCPHLRLIDSSLPVGVKLSNLTHEGAWKRRGVNAHKTCS